MSINYRLYQDNRKNSKKKGHWYARTVVTNCVDIKALAARISNSCTVTEPDILAVISALVTEMNYALTQGSKVKVDGLGTFRVGIHSHGVEKADDFNVQKDIFSPHVLFLPASMKVGTNKRVATLLSNLKLQEAEKYVVHRRKGRRRRLKGAQKVLPALAEVRRTTLNQFFNV